MSLVMLGRKGWSGPHARTGWKRDGLPAGRAKVPPCFPLPRVSFRGTHVAYPTTAPWTTLLDNTEGAMNSVRLLFPGRFRRVGRARRVCLLLGPTWWMKRGHSLTIVEHSRETSGGLRVIRSPLRGTTARSVEHEGLHR